MTTAGAFTLDYKSLTILEKQVRYRLGLGFLFVFLPNHLFHKDHDAPCLSAALKFCVPVLWILEHADSDTIHFTLKRNVSVQNISFTLIPRLSDRDGGGSNF